MRTIIIIKIYGCYISSEHLFSVTEPISVLGMFWRLTPSHFYFNLLNISVQPRVQYVIHHAFVPQKFQRIKAKQIKILINSVMRHVSHVMCHLSSVTAPATDPTPANSLTIHRLCWFAKT